MCLVPYGFRVELMGTSVCLNFANENVPSVCTSLAAGEVRGGERLPGLWVI